MTSHNCHWPTAHSLYINGDPRSNFNAGEQIEMCTAIHAEASLVARAAKIGIPLNGASVLVTTFPCPGCARLLVEAGIKKLYFIEGYSLLDSLEILKSSGVEVKRLVRGW